jgi:hypothetical protein
VETSRPPYSPDVASVDIFLLPTVKTILKGKTFQDVEDIKKNVTAELNAVLLEAFAVFKLILNDETNVFNLAEINLNRNRTFFDFL